MGKWKFIRPKKSVYRRRYNKFSNLRKTRPYKPRVLNRRYRNVLQRRARIVETNLAEAHVAELLREEMDFLIDIEEAARMGML